MSETEGASAPATEQAITAPAVAEQATPNEGIRDVDAAPENAEKPQEQPVADEGETEAKRLSRSQRYQRKISALSGVIERTEAEKQELRKQVEELRKAKASDTAPNPADFPNGEWDSGYIAKVAEVNALKAVDARLTEREKRDEQERQGNAVKTANQKLEESAAKIREQAPDFDATLNAFIEDGGEFAPHVRDAISASGEKAALIIYNLAKDPDHADRLNAMTPQEVLLEIGELRAKASLPERKTITKAPAPLRTVTGGAAPTADLASLAKSENADAYIAARRAQRKASA